MAPEIISKFLTLSEDQQTEIINLIEHYYHENKQTDITLAESLLEKDIEVYKRLVDL